MTEEKSGSEQIIFECKSDKKKIIFHIVFRLIMTGLVLYFIMMDREAFKDMVKGVAGIVLFSLLTACALVWALLPLKHLKDSLKFWENGIVIKGIKLSYDELGDVRFVNNDRGPFHYLTLYTAVERYDVSYVTDPQNNFERLYLEYTNKKAANDENAVKESDETGEIESSTDKPNTETARTQTN